jgi:hypothetical protein
MSLQVADVELVERISFSFFFVGRLLLIREGLFLIREGLFLVREDATWVVKPSWR